MVFVVNFLQEYLRIDTTPPRPRYDDVISLFIKQAQKDGFAYDVVPLGNAYKALVLTAPCNDHSQPGLAFTHHMDVVPVSDKSAWRFDPFGGVIHNGVIYGRGTQDMKGVGVAHYFGLRKFLDEGGTLKRPVYLILLPEEERGGYDGAGLFVEHPFFKKMRVGYVLDEGTPSSDSAFLNIKVSERKPIQICIESRGVTAHGSRINIKNAAHELVSFLQQLVVFQEAQRLNMLGQSPGLLLSVNITSFQFGTLKEDVIALNVVSEAATATVDIRVPPTMKLKDVLSFIDNLVARYPSISYKVASTVQERFYDHAYRNLFYKSVEKSIQANGLTAQPLHAEESSDLRFYLEKGIVGFGVTPFTCQENLHGVDESITLKDLELGRDVFCSIIKDFCR